METDTTQQSSPPISNDEYVDSVDFRSKAVLLISSDGESRDITNLVLEIQVRQDMYLGFMSGEMLLVDGTDLHTKAALHGNEYIYLHLTEPDQSISIKKAFRIYKLGNRFPTTSGGSRYMIYFSSPEMFESAQKKISKAYLSSFHSDIAKDILKNYMKVEEDRIIVDSTMDSQDVIIPQLRPAEALNWLASRSYSEDASCFMFYENLNGFNFRSLSSIYKDKMPVKVPFVFENKTGMKQLDMDKYTLDNIESKKDFDSLTAIRSGCVALGLLGIDPIRRTFTQHKFGQNTLPTLYPSPSMTNPDHLFSKTGAYTLTYLQNESTRSERFVRRVMNLAVLNNSQLEVTVPGNIRLQAGTLISLRIPYATTPSESDMWDKRKSGKYLIVAVNHKFDLINHRFNTLLLLARDSMPEALPAADNQLPDKIRKLNSKSNRD
jgi:hypothetical protein